MSMDKKGARRNMLLAGLLLLISAGVTIFGLGWIRFFIGLSQ